jgi:glyoxylase-like metal-dependent hydrolase (beta-lactamase superfamily II)
MHALIACPTASIGSRAKHVARAAIADFPMHLEADVFYCGFHSEKSYGGASYLTQHPDGNWLIDSPRFTEPLVRRIAALGGIARIFLTHRDDVADAARWAERFAAQRIIHREELRAQPNAEIIIDGDEPIALAPNFLAIPTPGHTRGHCCLLYSRTTEADPERRRGDQRPTSFLFSGDHLWWDRDTQALGAGREVCWWSWPEQVNSLRRLLDYSFDWVLPGHGARIHLPADQLHASLQSLVDSL